MRCGSHVCIFYQLDWWSAAEATVAKTQFLLNVKRKVRSIQKVFWHWWVIADPTRRSELGIQLNLIDAARTTSSQRFLILPGAESDLRVLPKDRPWRSPQATARLATDPNDTRTGWTRKFRLVTCNHLATNKQENVGKKMAQKVPKNYYCFCK